MEGLGNQPRREPAPQLLTSAICHSRSSVSIFRASRFLIVRYGTIKPDFAHDDRPSGGRNRNCQTPDAHDPRYYTTYYAIDVLIQAGQLSGRRGTGWRVPTFRLSFRNRWPLPLGSCLKRYSTLRGYFTVRRAPTIQPVADRRRLVKNSKALSPHVPAGIPGPPFAPLGTWCGIVRCNSRRW